MVYCCTCCNICIPYHIAGSMCCCCCVHGVIILCVALALCYWSTYTQFIRIVMPFLVYTACCSIRLHDLLLDARVINYMYCMYHSHLPALQIEFLKFYYNVNIQDKQQFKQIQILAIVFCLLFLLLDVFFPC